MSFKKITFYKSAFVVLALLTIFSCDTINEKILPSPTGKAGELLVVVDTAYWNNQTGEVLMKTFAHEQVGLPQREALFNVINIPHKSFVRVFRSFRNIVLMDIKPGNKASISVNNEVWAETQMIVTITAPNDVVAAATLSKNSEALQDYFLSKEIGRLQEKNKVNRNSKNAKLLRDKYNLSIHVDDFYVVAKQEEDFIWLRKDKVAGEHSINQGILIYTYPYISDSTFEVASLVRKRNFYTRKYVKGSTEESYIKVEDRYPPVEQEINLKNIYVKELRGLWHTQGEMMGGPFLSYTMVDETRDRVICIDTYVYAPKFDKQQYVRELEAIALTVTF